MRKFISLSYSWAENLRKPSSNKTSFTYIFCMLFINETLIKGNLISQTVQKMRTRVLFFDLKWLDIVQGQRGQLLSENTAQQSAFFFFFLKPLSLSFHKQVSTWQSFSFFLSFLLLSLLLSLLLPWFGRGLFGFQRSLFIWHWRFSFNSSCF